MAGFPETAPLKQWQAYCDAYLKHPASVGSELPAVAVAQAVSSGLGPDPLFEALDTLRDACLNACSEDTDLPMDMRGVELSSFDEAGLVDDLLVKIRRDKTKITDRFLDLEAALEAHFPEHRVDTFHHEPVARPALAVALESGAPKGVRFAAQSYVVPIPKAGNGTPVARPSTKSNYIKRWYDCLSPYFSSDSPYQPMDMQGPIFELLTVFYDKELMSVYKLASVTQSALTQLTIDFRKFLTGSFKAGDFNRVLSELSHHLPRAVDRFSYEDERNWLTRYRPILNDSNQLLKLKFQELEQWGGFKNLLRRAIGGYNRIGQAKKNEALVEGFKASKLQRIGHQSFYAAVDLLHKPVITAGDLESYWAKANNKTESVKDLLIQVCFEESFLAVMSQASSEVPGYPVSEIDRNQRAKVAKSVLLKQVGLEARKTRLSERSVRVATLAAEPLGLPGLSRTSLPVLSAAGRAAGDPPAEPGAGAGAL